MNILSEYIQQSFLTNFLKFLNKSRRKVAIFVEYVTGWADIFLMKPYSYGKNKLKHNIFLNKEGE